MTRDDIIRMAWKAGFNWPEIHTTTVEERLERFAALVAAAEREACEKVAEQELLNTSMLTSMPPKSSAAWNILQGIRARGRG